MSQVIRVTVTIDPDWRGDDRLVLFFGSENAADLSSSTPSGGTRVLDQAVVDGGTLEYRYTPTDKCATLPVGVAVQDAAGNLSALDETVVQLSDTPAGPTNLRVSQPTPGSSEALLEWDASPDV